ncbi:hypothetical protein [Shimia sp. SDUM112013]|uniref:hypothetical protein n=1 Tax=Shimia sp. SDUM112013 TaxID=3136160 RepID=UPI0032EE118D
MFRSLAVVALFLGGPVHAQEFMDDPSKCALLKADDRIGAVADGAMILHATGMDSIEYYCEFSPAIAFDWSGDAETQTRLGFCEEPGPFVFPTLFAFRMYGSEPGRVYVHADQTGEGRAFTLCD